MTTIDSVGLNWQEAVIEILLEAPPESPQLNDRYIVGLEPEGLWEGHPNAIATWSESGWTFVEAEKGMAVCVPEKGAIVGGKTYMYLDFWCLMTTKTTPDLLQALGCDLPICGGPQDSASKDSN
jgi:hypothetical protein